MTTTTNAQAGGGSTNEVTPTSSTTGILIVTNTITNSTNSTTNSNSNNNNNEHILPHQMSFREEDDDNLRHQHQLLGSLEDQDDGRRYLRSYIHPQAHQQVHNHHHSHHHHPHHHPHHLHHHPGEIQSNFEHLERDYSRPVDLGYVRGSYSPGSTNGGSAVAVAAAAAAVAGEWVGGGHQLGGGQEWMDVGGRGGLIWPAEAHNQNSRYHVPGMKWESSSVRPPSADETLAQLSVKELNKRVQNLPRDEVVALKQRRRTLKNRGYAMNCRLRRQETREKLEVHVKSLEDALRKLRCECDYFRSRCEKLQQQLNQCAMVFGPLPNAPPDGHGQGQGGLVPSAHDIPLHAHLVSHHAGQLHHGHPQPLQLDMPRNGSGNDEYKKYSNNPSSGAPCDLKRASLSRL